MFAQANEGLSDDAMESFSLFKIIQSAADCASFQVDNINDLLLEFGKQRIE